MTTAQKVIKYLAIGFAISIIVSIFSSLMFAFSIISNIFSYNDNNLENLEDLNISSDDISILDINVKFSNLIIKTGDKIKAETNNKYITYEQEGNKIIIKEKNHNWFTRNKNNSLVLYIPENFLFDGVAIETGAGKIEIDSISTKILNLNFGAGQATINNLVVDEYAKIDSGAGKITILDGSINNLNLDGGIGEFNLKSKLIGSNRINAGIGSINITLLGNLDDYNLIVEKGIGSAKLNGENIKSKKNYGDGNNTIDIDGGIGSINIKTK